MSPVLDGSKKEISLYSPQLIELMRAVFDKGLPFRFKARGGSMSPFIKDNDILTVARFPADYTIGDVLTFVRPCLNKLVVHRVVKKRGQSYLIKGDNGFEKDGYIPKENVLGRVIKVERGSRNISFGLGREKHIIAFFSRKGIFPIIFFLPRQVLRIFRLIRGQNND